MDVVKGESVWWTKSLRPLDTRPLRVFIIKSIRSLIICISTTMWGGAMPTVDGRLTSGHSGLLGALLPFGPSWYLLSVLVPSWSSSWVLCLAFLKHSCSSRLWFCLVRRSTTAVRVWTYLSRVVGCDSSPWTLFVVAIERVSTMQLYVRESIVWLIFSSHRWRKLMKLKKSPVSHTVLTRLKQYLHNKKRRLAKSTGVVPAKYPLKVKLELLTTLEYQSWGELCVPIF